MSADLHADPSVLRATATAVAELGASLHVAGLDPVDVAVLAGLAGGAAVVAAHDRLVASAARTHRALVEASAGLAAAATGLDATEHEAVRSLRAPDR